MGLAASQAQLLSVTSRISQNELRAQMIDDDKKRLAVASSEASAKYMMALENSQLMFTSFDKNNEKQTNELTYNNLTAYSQYNNQYVLTNAMGQALVSEKQTNNFKIAVTSGNPLKKFLELNGLKEGTTFFKSLSTDSEGEVLAYGWNSSSREYALDVSTGLTPEELEVMYFGGKLTHKDGRVAEYKGYDNTLDSNSWKQYQKLMGEYEAKFDTYKKITSPLIKEDINSYVKSLKELIEDTSVDGKEVFNTFKTSIEEIRGKCYPEDRYFDKVLLDFDKFETCWNKQENDTGATEVTSLGSNKFKIAFGEGLELTVEKTSNDYVLREIAYYEENDSGTLVRKTEPISEQKKPQLGAQPGMVAIEFGTQNTNSVYRLMMPAPTADSSLDPDKIYLQESYTSASEDYKEFCKMYSNIFAGEVFLHYSLDAVVKDTDEKAKAAQKEFFDSCSALSSYYRNTYQYSLSLYPADDDILLPDKETDRYQLNDLDIIFENYVDKHGSNFDNVYSIGILERIFDTYGEPKMTWIDDTNPTGSGAEHKVEWYTNLFERMKAGYKTIEDGLANSPEWIKTQLKNGNVFMEVHNKESGWTSFIYSNTREMQEKDNYQAIVTAEAEYNQEIQKINVKDQRLDQQVKMLDTEHGALLSEYESVQQAMNKNVERVLKYFS